MTTCIFDQDLNHLYTFPVERKGKVMQQIMSKSPLEERAFVGNNHYEKTVAQLRTDGFSLIDFQPLETAFSMVWYRKTTRFLGLVHSEAVAMLVWEFKGYVDTITLRTWQI